MPEGPRICVTPLLHQVPLRADSCPARPLLQAHAHLKPSVTPVIMLLTWLTTVRSEESSLRVRKWQSTLSFCSPSISVRYMSAQMCDKSFRSVPRGPLTVIRRDFTSTVTPSGMSSVRSAKMGRIVPRRCAAAQLLERAAIVRLRA